ncbi:MAG: tRNA (adenosine(37)-N6)-threonylcarbamoyltransferase complex transferase subunit TsaD [Aquificae bacterium]|nr:tRNA (adenosine(37)-N6)-threonylcarbamoyltransferase complex transferase subunit TsaD [Aquificota bacterium]
MKVLGIETSCDDTAVAIYDNEKGILSNVVSSQVKLHEEWGGVYPDLAAREHTKNIIPVLDKALKDANLSLKDIDIIAFTAAPGLIVSLVIGISAAKSLAWTLNKPLVPVHHIEAHIFAVFLKHEINYPFLALVVSGGHTELYIIKAFEDYQYLGGTLDDAVGEAYDKVARMLNLGYPGGPIIDKLSKSGKPQISFPRPLIKDKDKHKYNFSFSGLKSAVLRETEKNFYKIEDIATSFQEAAVDVLTTKTIKAAIEFNIQNIVVAGGVSANSRLREKLLEEAKKHNLNVYFPPLYLCTDNAAMVAFTGYKRFSEKGTTVGFDFEGKARIRMDKFVEYIKEYYNSKKSIANCL